MTREEEIHKAATKAIPPYMDYDIKEEIMKKDTNKAIFECNAQSCDIMNDIIKE